MTTIEAPPHWAHVRLDAIAEVRLGRQRSPQRATGPNMVPYLRAANVTWRGIDLGDVKEMDFTASEVETYRLLPGDILLAEASGSASEVGKPAVYSAGAVVHCFQNTLIRVRSNSGVTAFLHLHFLKDALLGSFGKASRGVGIHHLGAEALSAWEVCIPPLGEQGRLTDVVDSYLSRLDAAVASLERAQAKLKAYRASVLKAAVEGRLVPTEAELARKENRSYEPAPALLARILEERRRRWEQAELAKPKAAGKTPKDARWKATYEEPAAPDASKLPGLPDGWCWASMSALLSEPLRNGHSARETADEDGVRTLTLSAVTDADFGLHNTKMTVADPEKVADLWLRPGDIFVERANTAELVGTSALYRGQPNFAIFPDLLVRVRCTERVPGEFIELVLMAPMSRLHFQRAAQGIAGSMPKISQGTIAGLAVPLPPAAEQERIVAEVQRLRSVETAVLNEASRDERRVQRLGHAILKWAFEGKLVDQDPKDEPADKLLARIHAERAAAPPTSKTRGRRAKATP
jgi:type I restriction enzyme S subunit